MKIRNLFKNAWYLIERVYWNLIMQSYFERFILNISVVRNKEVLDYYYSVFKQCDEIINKSSLEVFNSKINKLSVMLKRANYKRFNRA